MNKVDYVKTLIILAMIAALSLDSAQAQYAQPPAMPPSPETMQLSEDTQNAQQVRTSYEQYSAQVNNYVQQVQQQCADIDVQEKPYRERYELLENEIKEHPKQAKASASELSKLRSWLDNEELIKSQDQQNIKTALGWLSYLRGQMNNAQYTVNEDQQQLTDSALRQEQVAEEQERQAQLQVIENQIILQNQADDDDGGEYYGPVPAYGVPYVPYGRYGMDHRFVRVPSVGRGVVHGGGIARGGGGGRSGGGGGGGRSGGGGGGRR